MHLMCIKRACRFNVRSRHFQFIQLRPLQCPSIDQVRDAISCASHHFPPLTSMNDASAISHGLSPTPRPGDPYRPLPPHPSALWRLISILTGPPRRSKLSVISSWTIFVAFLRHLNSTYKTPWPPIKIIWVSCIYESCFYWLDGKCELFQLQWKEGWFRIFLLFQPVWFMVHIFNNVHSDAKSYANSWPIKPRFQSNLYFWKQQMNISTSMIMK